MVALDSHARETLWSIAPHGTFVDGHMGTLDVDILWAACQPGLEGSIGSVASISAPVAGIFRYEILGAAAAADSNCVAASSQVRDLWQRKIMTTIEMALQLLSVLVGGCGRR